MLLALAAELVVIVNRIRHKVIMPVCVIAATMHVRKCLTVALLSLSAVSVVLVWLGDISLIFGGFRFSLARSKLPSRFTLARSKLPDWLNGSASIDVVPSGFAVDTPSCRIPDFDAYNPSILPYVRDPDRYLTICNHSLPVTFADRQYIRLNKTLAHSLGVQHCSYQEVSRIRSATVS